MTTEIHVDVNGYLRNLLLGKVTEYYKDAPIEKVELGIDENGIVLILFFSKSRIVTMPIDNAIVDVVE